MKGLAVRPNAWGHGLFTTQDCKAGQILCPLGGQLVAWDSMPNFQVGMDTWMGPSRGPTDQLNHGCDPNAAAMVDKPGYPLQAVRDIPANTEVLIDYSVTATKPRKPFKCLCGATTCRGQGGGAFDSIPPWDKERYLKRDMIPRYVLDHYLSALL